MVHPLRGRCGFVDVEAEQQGADRVVRGLVHAVAGDHAIGRAHVLDLAHHALVGLIGEVGALGDQAVEAGSLEALEPVARDRLVAGERGQMDGRRGVREGALERRAPVCERLVREIVVAEREQVEGDEAGGGLAGEQRHPAGGGMDALLERPEVEPAVAGDDDLAVDHATLRQVAPDGLDHLGEVARHRPLLAAADLDLVAVAEHDRAEAVPLRLVELAGRDRGHGLGQHRRDRRQHRQVHRGRIPCAGRKRFAGSTSVLIATSRSRLAP